MSLLKALKLNKVRKRKMITSAFLTKLSRWGPISKSFTMFHINPSSKILKEAVTVLSQGLLILATAASFAFNLFCFGICPKRKINTRKSSHGKKFIPRRQASELVNDGRSHNRLWLLMMLNFITVFQ